MWTKWLLVPTLPVLQVRTMASLSAFALHVLNVQTYFYIFDSGSVHIFNIDITAYTHHHCQVRNGPSVVLRQVCVQNKHLKENKEPGPAETPGSPLPCARKRKLLLIRGRLTSLAVALGSGGHGHLHRGDGVGDGQHVSVGSLGPLPGSDRRLRRPHRVRYPAGTITQSGPMQKGNATTQAMRKF